MRFLLVTATRGGSTREMRCRFGVRDPGHLDGLDEQAANGYPVRLTPALLERLSGPGLQIPDLRQPIDLELAEWASVHHPRLEAADGWRARFGRELNASDDREHFSEGGPGLPVIDGKHLSPFVVSPESSSRRIAPAAARRLLAPSVTFTRPRLAFRDVAGAANRLTLIAGVVPAGCVTTHTLFCLRTALGQLDQWLLCALLNSYVANYLVRLRVSSHVSLATMAWLPVPRPLTQSRIGRRLAACARRLASARSASGPVHAEVQALAARAYALTPRLFAHVLQTFPLVEESERRAAYDTFLEMGGTDG